MVYTDEKINSHKPVIVQYTKITCISNKFNNKLKKYLSKNWSEVVFNFNTLTEYTIKKNFVTANQLILECNVLSTMVK